MRVMCAKDDGDTSGKGRPLEGFIRGKPPSGDGEKGAENGAAQDGAENASKRQPFGFYRPNPENEERDRVARRLWKQVFGS